MKFSKFPCVTEPFGLSQEMGTARIPDHRCLNKGVMEHAHLTCPLAAPVAGGWGVSRGLRMNETGPA